MVNAPFLGRDKPMNRGISGSFQRTLNYVRLSVTDRCNFRCRYCMPEEGVPSLGHEAVLSYEDMLFLVDILVSLGVQRLRLTGGEPFVRKGFMDFAQNVRKTFPSLELAITTNGSLLAPWGKALEKLHLQSMSISLDTLNPLRFQHITRCGRLEDVLQGIRLAQTLVKTVKINTVLVRGFNHDELVPLVDFARSQQVLLRFIECMPLDMSLGLEGAFISAGEMRAALPQKDLWVAEQEPPGVAQGPSRYYRNQETRQRVGFITAVSEHFCESCNRIRLDAQGLLIPCLYYEDGKNIKQAMAEGDIQKATEILRDVLKNKPEKNKWGDDETSGRAFYEVGG